MSKPPVNPPPTNPPPTAPPDTRPPNKPPNKAEALVVDALILEADRLLVAEFFAQVDAILDDLTTPPAPKPQLPKPVGPPRFTSGEHRLVGHVGPPAESESEALARLMVSARRPLLPGTQDIADQVNALVRAERRASS